MAGRPPPLTAPPGMRVVVGVGADALVDEAAARIRAQRPLDPFIPTTVLVHSRGMARWVSHQLADRLGAEQRGIASDLDVQFPGDVIARIVEACGVEAPTAAWQPRPLAWTVARILQRDQHHADLASLRHPRCPPAAIDRPTWQLGRAIADVFNEYVVSRPDMVRRWEHGDDAAAAGGPLDPADRWQPALWRRLVTELGDPVAPMDRALAVLANDGGDLATVWPAGLHVFGLSVLPPRLFAVIEAASRHVGVSWYVPAVSPRAWADAVAGRSTMDTPRHPLAALNGRLTADSVRLFADAHSRGAVLDVAVVESARESRPPATRLERLQRAIIDDDPVPEEPARFAVDPSIAVHGAHSDMRQAEIVRDAVLDALDADDALEPRDVLILVPDTERHGPVITAAFAGDGRRPDVPVVVADRHLGITDPVVDLLLALLTTAASRVTASEVLDLLEHEPLARRFRLTAADQARARSWVVRTGIRWGIDEDDRRAHRQPADRAHTWRAGLDALLLGVALANEDDRVVGGVVPFDDVEGDDVEVLARVVEAVEAVLTSIAQLRGARPFDEWRAVLRAVAERLMAVDDPEAWRLVELAALIEEVTADADVTADLEALTAAFADHLGSRHAAAGYETGAVTVCEFLPLRSIPHAVVAVVGVDDGAFPRSGRRPGFDLVDRAPRPGDRDRRAEDRHLFLEALLSARQRFLLVATMRDVRTNTPISPSVVVTEVCETLDAWEATPDGAAGTAVTRQHALHAHSAEEFGGNGARPWSFDAAAHAAAVARAARISPTTTSVATFAARAMPALTVAELARRLAHPTRHLLADRLGIVLTRYVDDVVDDEPLAIDPWLRPALLQQIRDRRRDGNLAAWRDAQLASGSIPTGAPGAVALDALIDVVAELDRRLRADGQKLGIDDLHGADGRSVEVPFGPARLRADVQVAPAAWGTLVVHVDTRRRTAERRLVAWLTHLVASATLGTVATIAAFRPGEGSIDMDRFVPLGADAATARDAANRMIDELATIADRADREVLPLFAVASPKLVERDLVAAAEAFVGNEYRPGDLDPYVTQVYGADATLDDVLAPDGAREMFVELAMQVWQPVFAHRVSRIQELAAAVEAVGQ